MTLYDAYLRYKRTREQIENDFKEKFKANGGPTPKLLMELSDEFRDNQDITTFTNYTQENPLTVKELLRFLSESTNKKWSCKAKLGRAIPDHIRHDLQTAGGIDDQIFKNVCSEILNTMKDETFFEMIFYTTQTDNNTDVQTSFEFPFTISTTSSYEELKSNPNLLKDMNFYVCLFDGVFKSSGTIWTICPNKYEDNFMPNVVKNYIKTVHVGEKGSDKEKDF